MMWRKENVIQCQGVSQYYIDVDVRGNEEWRLTGIYGEPRWDHKHLTWENLSCQKKTWENLRVLHNNLSLGVGRGSLAFLLYSWVSLILIYTLQQ